MRIYVDCEFNGFGGELISMALVAEDGREWYEVLPLPRKDDLEPWVAANVVPVLLHASVDRDDFYASLHRWLLQFRDPVIVADWPADLIHFFAALMGTSHEKTLQYPCSAILDTNIEYESAIPHNALEDARAIRRAVCSEA